MKKSRILAMLILVCLLSTLVSANAIKVTLNDRSILMFKGEKTTLEINGVKSSSVKWSSSNKAVATVSKKGVVTAKKAGTAVVTGKYNKVTFKCKVTVQVVKKLNKVLYNGELGKMVLKQIDSRGFVIKFTNKTDVKLWIESEILIVDGKQLNATWSEDVDENGNYIQYNYYETHVPSGWSLEDVIYIKNPSVNVKKFSGHFKVLRQEGSSGYDYGEITFKNVKLK